MNPDKYRDLFVQEAREHLAQLADGLVTLETRFDRAVLDALFRAAHSLKGMAATLGHNAEAELAHALEDHLVHIRAAESLPQGIVGPLLEASDLLGACVDAIERGAPRPDTAAAVARLRAALGEPAAHDLPATVPAAAALERLHDALRDLPEAERHLLAVTLRPGCLAPRARLLVLERTIAAFGTLVAAQPDRAAWKTFTPASGPVLLAVQANADVSFLCARLAATPDVLAVEPQEPTPVPSADARAEPPGPAATRTVRVDVARIDRILDRTGELRIAEAQLGRLLDGFFVGRKPQELQEALRRVAQETKALQDLALELRTLPVALATGRLPRLVRDLAARMGKHVRFEVAGEDTQVDRSVLEAIGDPLVHLVKNAVDHGIEPPAERAAKGKPATGTVRVSFHRGNSGIDVEVSDDGRGVPRERLVQRAARLGLVDAATAARMPDRDLFRLLGTPGLSTAEAVTDVSGRGVGLDAVFAEVERLGGSCTIRSDQGAGTTITLRLPPTLAVVEALECDVDGEPCYVPVDAVLTTLSLSAEDRRRGQVSCPDPSARRDDVPPEEAETPLVEVPLRALGSLLGFTGRPSRYQAGVPQAARMAQLTARLRGADADVPVVAGRARVSRRWRPDRESIGSRGTTGPVGVVVARHGHALCLAVDAVRAIREVVVKSLDVPGGGRFVAGATIQGDGRVGLILDVPSLLAAEALSGRASAPRP